MEFDYVVFQDARVWRRKLKIGVTGHQERNGIDWPWVRTRLERLLIGKAELIGYSCLAAGTDQVFAETVLKKGGHLTAVIPIENYVSYFVDEALEKYQRLFALASIIELKSKMQDEQAFLDAGKWIVRETDQMIAVWDGEQAGGAGGTGDIVACAILLGRPVIHINPINRKTVQL